MEEFFWHFLSTVAAPNFLNGAPSIKCQDGSLFSWHSCRMFPKIVEVDVMFFCLVWVCICSYFSPFFSNMNFDVIRPILNLPIVTTCDVRSAVQALSADAVCPAMAFTLLPAHFTVFLHQHTFCIPESAPHSPTQPSPFSFPLLATLFLCVFDNLSRLLFLSDNWKSHFLNCLLLAVLSI